MRERDRVGESRYEWFGMDKLARHQLPDGSQQRFVYDGEERLVEFVNAAGFRHRFEIDPRGDVVAEVGFDGRRSVYERDAAGRVSSLTTPSGRKRTHRYNLVDQLVKVETGDGEAIEFGYRPDGQMISARNQTCTVRIERDPRGIVTREWQDSHWVSSSVDSSGRRTQMRSSFGADLQIARASSGAWMGMRYHDAHRADAQPVWQVALQRDAGGRESIACFLGSAQPLGLRRRRATLSAPSLGWSGGRSGSSLCLGSGRTASAIERGWSAHDRIWP
ncbi:MAG: hypothetical protein HC927_09065 [Deltaproteobacteria bacterium]|nr:hypothetical protein [Deltaproteobacteria bacterium]